MAIDIRLDTVELDRIAGALKTNTERVCVRFAFQVERLAKELAPVDTGALRSSIYTVTQNSSGAGAAEVAAGMNPKAKFADIPAPDGDIYANVGPSVEYAIYQEYGTSKMAAHPFLTPAAEQMRSRYNSGEEWRSLVE